MIKDIINFENYQISDDGRVWSKKSNKWLKPIDVNGYKKASLYKNGKLCQRLIHRLVAEAFIPNPNNYEEINHINEDKSDNRGISYACIGKLKTYKGFKWSHSLL